MQFQFHQENTERARFSSSLPPLSPHIYSHKAVHHSKPRNLDLLSYHSDPYQFTSLQTSLLPPIHPPSPPASSSPDTPVSS